VIVFYATDVTPENSRAMFDVALGQITVLSQLA
jgi:hypothetical protein